MDFNNSITVSYIILTSITTLILLFTLGNIVYSLGEFKHHFNKVPRVMLILFSKIISITSIIVSFLYFMLNYSFAPPTHEIIQLIYYLFTTTICLELIMTNKTIIIFTKYSLREHHPIALRRFSKIVRNYFLSKKKKTIYIIFLSNIFLPILLIISLWNMATQFQIFGILAYFMNFYTSFLLTKII